MWFLPQAYIKSIDLHLLLAIGVFDDPFCPFLYLSSGCDHGNFRMLPTLKLFLIVSHIPIECAHSLRF